MRQIFRSRRLENVEGVARLLAEHGIETYTSQPRSYKGSRRRSFSFSDSSAVESALWIVNGNDITRARQVMADAGLLETERRESGFDLGGQHAPLTLAKKSVSTASKVRRALLFLAVVLAALNFVRWMLADG
jgi:hypothetical protein